MKIIIFVVLILLALLVWLSVDRTKSIVPETKTPSIEQTIPSDSLDNEPVDYYSNAKG